MVLNMLVHKRNTAWWLCMTAYTNVANGKFLGISYLIWIALIVAAITWFIFNMTRHGKYMYAIGGNPQAAEVAGVPVKQTLILIYMKAAAMYGLAGFMLGAKAGGASVQLGYGYEMEAIAACTIGGVSVTGGRGKVSSAIIGVAVFELLKSSSAVLGSKCKRTVHCNWYRNLRSNFSGYQKIRC